MKYPNAATLRRIASTVASVPTYPTFIEKCFSMIMLHAAEGQLSLEMPVSNLRQKELKEAKKSLQELGYSISTKRRPMMIGNGKYSVLCISWAN